MSKGITIEEAFEYFTRSMNKANAKIYKPNCQVIMDFKDKDDLLDSMDYSEAMSLQQGYLFGKPVQFVNTPHRIEFNWSN